MVDVIIQWFSLLSMSALLLVMLAMKRVIRKQRTALDTLSSYVRLLQRHQIQYDWLLAGTTPQRTQAREPGDHARAVILPFMGFLHNNICVRGGDVIMAPSFVTPGTYHVYELPSDFPHAVIPAFAARTLAVGHGYATTVTQAAGTQGQWYVPLHEVMFDEEIASAEDDDATRELIARHLYDDEEKPVPLQTPISSQGPVRRRLRFRKQ